MIIIMNEDIYMYILLTSEVMRSKLYYHIIIIATMETKFQCTLYEKFKSHTMIIFYYGHMIKAGYYFGNHMTGSISNQFTSEY